MINLLRWNEETVGGLQVVLLQNDYAAKLLFGKECLPLGQNYFANKLWAIDDSGSECAAMADVAGPPTQQKQIIASFLAFTAAQNELVRLFARSNHMHSTDAAAVVQIIEHEDQDRPLTPAGLAARIGLSPGATSILLARLETAGFVSRTREHSDRRVVTLRSTKSINDAADAFFEPLAQQLENALAAFAPDEIDAVNRAAGELQSVLESYVRTAASEMESS